MGTPKMNRPSARIGYARVSTADQNLDAQMAALEATGSARASCTSKKMGRIKYSVVDFYTAYSTLPRRIRQSPKTLVFFKRLGREMKAVAENTT